MVYKIPPEGGAGSIASQRSIIATQTGLQCLYQCQFIVHHIYLTHYHTMSNIDALKLYSCGKHCGKRRNCLLQAISPFLTLFSTLYGTYFSFSIHFKMSSAICFNLDQSKILSSDNGLKGNGATQGSYISLFQLESFFDSDFIQSKKALFYLSADGLRNLSP